ncbi:MAG TPA: hypothetical protein VII25_09430 [Candidatus Acidoferrum sp.]
MDSLPQVNCDVGRASPIRGMVERLFGSNEIVIGSEESTGGKTGFLPVDFLFSSLMVADCEMTVPFCTSTGMGSSNGVE